MRSNSIEERAVELAQYIIDSKDTVRGAARKFGISKSTVHTEVTLKNGKENKKIIEKSSEIRVKVGFVTIEDNLFGPKTIKGVFLSKINPKVTLSMLIN